jgi:hypothetical protein
MTHPLDNFLQPPHTSSHLGPNIFLSVLFSNIIRLCFSLNVRDQVLRPYQRRGKVITLYILLSMHLDIKREDNPDNISPCSDQFIVRSMFTRGPWGFYYDVIEGSVLLRYDVASPFSSTVHGPSLMDLEPFELRTARSFQTSQNTRPATQRHIREYWILKSLRFRTLL